MVKTQVYFEQRDLRALHRLAKLKKRRVADMVREAVRSVWLQGTPDGPIALAHGELRGTSMEHDSAFDAVE